MGLHQSFPNFINYLKDLQDALSAQVRHQLSRQKILH